VYGGRDPRELSLYGPRDAAACLNLPEKTILNWLAGHDSFRSVLTVKPGQRQLSFYNLCEAFVLSELRRRSRYSLQVVRKIIAELRVEYPSLKYPLAQLDLQAVDSDAFLARTAEATASSPSGKLYQKSGQAKARAELFAKNGDEALINISDRGRRLVFESVVNVFLKRVDRTPIEGVVRLYPFITPSRDPNAPKSVMVDARVAFGKPVIAGTGIPTAAVYQLFNAGDTIQKIADEYERDPAEIESAIRYESVRAKRAA